MLLETELVSRGRIKDASILENTSIFVELSRDDYAVNSIEFRALDAKSVQLLQSGIAGPCGTAPLLSGSHDSLDTAINVFVDSRAARLNAARFSRLRVLHLQHAAEVRGVDLAPGLPLSLEQLTLEAACITGEELGPVPADLDIGHLLNLTSLTFETYASHQFSIGSSCRMRLPASLRSLDRQEPSRGYAGGHHHRRRFQCQDSEGLNPLEYLDVAAVELIQLDVHVRRSTAGQLQPLGMPAVPAGCDYVSLNAPEVQINVEESGSRGPQCSTVGAMVGLLLAGGVPSTCKRMTIQRRHSEALTVEGTWARAGVEFSDERVYTSLSLLEVDIRSHGERPLQMHVKSTTGGEILEIDVA